MATYALSKLLRRPIKFVADRVESFNTDIHARDHRCKGRIGVKRDGTITAFEIDDLTASAPIRCIAHQRDRGQPGRQPRRRPLCDQELSRAGPRRVPEQERDVPVPRRRHPVACSVTEGLVDLALQKSAWIPSNPSPQSDCR